MHWSELNLPVSMQGKSKELKNIYVEAANKSFSKFKDEQAAVFAASQAVSIEERRLANEKRKAAPQAPTVPLHLKAVLDAAKTVSKPVSKQDTIQQAFLPKNALQSGLNRSLVSADFDDKGQLVLLFDTGEKIVTSEIAIKEYIEQNIAIAPNTQIISADESIQITQTNQTFDLGTASVINPLDHLDFNLDSTSTGAVGRLKWNDTDGTLEFGMRGGNVTQQIGQELPIPVKHADNAGLINGRAVYQAGSNGDNILVRYAQANSETTSAKVFGVLTESANGGAPAFCTTFGIVRDINTSNLTEGEAIWLSPSSAGGLTTTKPSAPNHLVFIGLCIRSHATQGKIFVNTQNGYELEELHNVSISNLEDGQVLTYESSTGLWKNKTATASSTSKATTHFVKINTVANTPYTVTHNLGLVDKDAFTINTMLSGSQVQAAISSVNVNSLTITTSVATTDLAVSIIGIKP